MLTRHLSTAVVVLALGCATTEPAVDLGSAQADAIFEETYYPGDTPHHQIGRPGPDRSWEVDVSSPPAQFLTYGPYTSAVPAGRVTARFTLALDNVSNDDLRILSVDVNDVTAGRVVASRDIRRTELRAPFEPQDLSVEFFLDAPGHVLEFRVFWWGNSFARHLKTTVSVSAGDAPPSDLLAALWVGQAHFEHRATIVWPQGDESSGWVAVKDGVWYLFNRQYGFAERPAACGGLDHARTVVHESRDQGRTWSDRVPVVDPDQSNDYANCAVLDGSSFFDPDTGTWHLLAQCLGSSAAWRLCHYTRQDPSPMGRFTPDPANPSVDIGALWAPICGGSGKSCPPSTIDEGTPDILYKRNGYFYVTFHGYDPGPRAGYRGAARTRDFVTWEVDAPDLPGDAMFGSRDCQAWNPGCIGGGEATTTVSGDYHYMLIEAPDLGLACTDGQYWVFGLMRARGLARSGGWESFHANPLLKPSQRRACGLQYARFIRDGGQLFLLYEDLEKGRRLFELVRGGGPPVVE